jgi:stage III sporulation protein AG
MVSTKQGDKPLLLTEIAPRVKGVVVVCEGGGNAMVIDTVTEALATALNISKSQVCVVAKS